MMLLVTYDVVPCTSVSETQDSHDAMFRHFYLFFSRLNDKRTWQALLDPSLSKYAELKSWLLGAQPAAFGRADGAKWLPKDFPMDESFGTTPARTHGLELLLVWT